LRESTVQFYYEGQMIKEVVDVSGVSVVFVHHIVDLRRRYGRPAGPYAEAIDGFG
jgi:hypothetical protein